jgi:antitoxin component of RelBE/YafQ-DinJ toxin-antitoxin module
MATLSLRMRDDLKAKAQPLASKQGVSLNSYINATLAATIAQTETLAMMGDRLCDVDQEQLHARVMKFMSKTQSGIEPSATEIQNAIAGQS